MVVCSDRAMAAVNSPKIALKTTILPALSRIVRASAETARPTALRATAVGTVWQDAVPSRVWQDSTCLPHVLSGADGGGNRPEDQSQDMAAQIKNFEGD